ncbi:cytochrome P450 [Melanogaster broomeanus]|nr:cytochrome P450 [Melanogaster broomeanus]
MIQQGWAFCAGLLLLSFVLVHWLTARTRRLLPPGPPGIPFLGNVDLIPKINDMWSAVSSLGGQYGDLASFTAIGRVIILINSAKVAEDLLEKRSSIYSDRPRVVMAGELCGLGRNLLFSQYNDWFRGLRKLVAQEIGSYTIVQTFYPMLEHESHRFLVTVLERPGELQAHVRKTFTAIVLRIAYGYEVKGGHDYFVDLAHVANEQFVQCEHHQENTTWTFLPLLKYIPSWLPGAGFRRIAKKYAATMEHFTEAPYAFVKQEMESGTHSQSFVSRHLAQNPNESEEELIKWAANVMYQGSRPFTLSHTYAFFLAMTLYPDVQKKAQAELDAVVGSDRLPTFADRPSLPYCGAVFTELLRWMNPAPFTMRQVREENHYQGYTIPAGAYVIANIWCVNMMHDENIYKDPITFNPERFLGDNPETDPRNACFGFGRRKCPGYFLAYSSVWLVCIQALAVFEISKTVEDGVQVTPEVKMAGGVIFHPLPFKCSIKARSPEAQSLITQGP